MIIRKATIEDSARIRELLLQLGYDLEIAQIQKKIAAYLDEKQYEILVAQENGIILGLITAIFYESFCFKSGCCMHIETLIVDDKARGKGVGKQLVSIIEENAVKKYNCDYSELLTLSSRRKDGTHNFYKNLGYQDHDKTNITYFSKMLTSNFDDF